MTTMTDTAFVHRFVDGNRVRPLLLLHGTGGDENDLLPLGAHLAPESALLSPRGQVLEHGMPRFFRRFAEGRFDHEDVRRRADELADFVAEARARHGLGAPVAVGFSNGANIAAAILYRRPESFAGAVLIRAMTPLPEAPGAIPGTPVLILSGAMDPIVPRADAVGLAAALASAGAEVRHEQLPSGHQLGQRDLVLAREWLSGVRRG
jgi:phospholipase/carboxylesterase